MASSKPNATPEKIKSLLMDLGKPTKRGIRKCPQCGMMNGTRGLTCKNHRCEYVFKESSRKKEKNIEAVKLVTGPIVQLFSVRLRDRGPDYRGFVQLPVVQDLDGNPADNVDPSVLVPVLKSAGKCYVEHCSRAVSRNSAPVCQHIIAAIECKEEAKALKLKNSVLNSLQVEDETRSAIWELATETQGPLVQKVTQHMMVVKCKASAKHPLGFLHFSIYAPNRQKDGVEYITKFQCSCKESKGVRAFEEGRKRCLHFYACAVSFASDESMAEKYAPFIKLVSFNEEQVFERYTIDQGVLTQGRPYADTVELETEEETETAHDDGGAEENLVVEALDPDQSFHVITQHTSSADVITTISDVTAQMPTTSFQASDISVEDSDAQPDDVMHDVTPLTSSMITSSDAIVNGELISQEPLREVDDGTISKERFILSNENELSTPVDVIATGDVLNTHGDITTNDVMNSHHDVITTSSIMNVTSGDVTMYTSSGDAISYESNGVTFLKNNVHDTSGNSSTSNFEIVVDDENSSILTPINQEQFTSVVSNQLINKENQEIITPTTDGEQFLGDNCENSQALVVDSENQQIVDASGNQHIILQQNEESLGEPGAKRIKLTVLSDPTTEPLTHNTTDLVTVAESRNTELIGEPQVLTMASELLQKRPHTSETRTPTLLKYAQAKKSESGEGGVQLSFLQWLSSVTERINQTMHYQFAGSPDPLVFHAPQVFFDCLQARISAGSKKKRLPNHTSSFVRRDALPLGTFIKYTWYITNILHVKQIFDTSEVSVDITRSFVENRDGTFDLMEKSARDKDFSDDGKNLPIRPFQLKTYLKVGHTSPNQKEATPFVIEWIPDILPRSHIGELRIKFEYGHQRNGHLEDRAKILSGVS